MKPPRTAPAAYVLPADEPRPGLFRGLLRVLQSSSGKSRAQSHHSPCPLPVIKKAQERTKRHQEADRKKARATTRDFPSKLFIAWIQPYSVFADALLAQHTGARRIRKDPLDDTAGRREHSAYIVRVTDLKFLDVAIGNGRDFHCAGALKAAAQLAINNMPSLPSHPSVQDEGCWQ